MPYIASNGEKVYDYEEIFTLDMGDNIEDEEENDVECQKNEVIYNHFMTEYLVSKQLL
jgi:hypothetical protein